MAHRKLTPGRLLDACEQLLATGSVALEFADCDKKYDAYCETEYDEAGQPTSVSIVIDPSRVGYIPGLLHELLHVVLTPVFRSLNTVLDEYLVRQLEEKLWQKHFSAARVIKWRKLAQSLLSKGATDVVRRGRGRVIHKHSRNTSE